MPRTRDPFGQALSDLRLGLAGGEHAPGRPIVIIDEARRLRLSPTPVREALAHLAGEGLIEAGPAGGYVAPRLDAADIRERYDLHQLYVRAALQRVASASPSGLSSSDPSASAAAVGAVFDRLLLRAADRTLASAYLRARQLLAMLRRAERRVVSDPEREAPQLANAADREDWAAFETLAASWHDRRRALVGPLLLALGAESGSASSDGVQPTRPAGWAPPS